MSELIGVVGAGTMGNGIAQVAARAGYDVVLRDVKDEFLARGMTAIDRSLQRDVDKERLKEEEKRTIVGRIRTTTELSDLSGAAFVVAPIIDAAKAYCTEQEICDVLREVFGTYTDPAEF